MDKMKMETANKTLENLAKLKEMFPEVITETKDANGDIVSAVDAKKLEQLLSTKVIEGDEAYDFTWVGKKQAMVEANRPIRKTLRPCKEESVDWENTENLYIEGDNLDVLKLLQESYLNKIKMIYIDPPYNTGNDSFIYPDDYKTNKDQYDEEVGAIDESGYIMFKNTETNGRFHSSWCSMMYPRLKLARNLLSEDGVIFISIDDHEVDNMKKICDEVFGGSNFVSTFIVTSAPAGTQSAVNVSIQHSYCICYAKSFSKIRFLVKRTQEELANRYSDSDEKGNFYCERLWKRGVGGRKEDVPSLHFPVYFHPETNKILIDVEYNDEDGFVKIIPYHTEGVLGRWTWSRESMISKRENLIVKKVAGEWKLHKKVYDCEETGKLPFSIIGADVGRTEIGGIEVKNIFNGKKLFEYPKSVIFVKHFLKFMQSDGYTVLDFFSGSATTAHAVMQLNAEDGGKRKFIMVQLPEVCDEKSEAYKTGYKNICEIGKERIRRAGKKIVEETGKKDLDIGFRVLKLDESNMKDVYYAPADYNQSMLDKMTSNIKEDRTPEDLLYACMLEWGLELSLPHKVENIAGYNVHIVNDGDLIACFDNRISEEAIKQIADKKPLRAVFRDSSFASDASRVNVGEIFKLKSPNTTIKVI